MPSDTLLIESSRTWPWGLVLISDSGSEELLPESWDGVVVAVSTSIAVRILHAVDGEATAEVWVGHVPDGLILVHEGEMDIPTGIIEVSDAAGDRIDSAAVATGTHPVRIYVDNEVHPERVVVALDSH